MNQTPRGLKARVVFDSNSTVARKQVWQPSPKFHECIIVFLINTMNHYASIHSFTCCHTIYSLFKLNLSIFCWLGSNFNLSSVFHLTSSKNYININNSCLLVICNVRPKIKVWGGGVWNGRGCLEKNSTVMNENSGVWENSCDRI